MPAKSKKEPEIQAETPAETPEEAPKEVNPGTRAAFSTVAFDDRVVQAPGKPRRIAGICEFCGTLSCEHYG